MELTMFKLFGKERDGHRINGLLLIQSVFIGLYYGIFNITAHAVFLSRFDEADMARAYILSGLVGSALILLYSFFQSKLRFSFFSVLNLIFSLVLTVLLWIIVRSDPEPWMVYAFFIMLGPLFIIALMGLRSTAGKLLKLQESSRLSGFTDSALISGLIIGSFAVPLLLFLGIETHNMLFISAISILMVVLIQVNITGRHKNDLRRISSSGESKTGFKVLVNNKYLRLLAVFFVFSVLVLFFIQYSFMAVTRIRYPGEFEMARFLGYFEGSMMVVALLINLFLFSGIIRKQGMEIALSLSPVLIGLFTIVAIVLGITSEISAGTSGFVIFFLILAFSRIISRSMNISIERPALDILCRALEEKLRRRVESAVDGSLNEIAVVAAGLILTGFGALSFVRLIHFSWVLIILVVVWVLIGLRLYKEYRQSIKKILDEGGLERADESLHIDRKKLDSVGSAVLFIDNNYFEILTSSEIHDSITDNRLVIKQIINKAEKNLNPDILPLLRHLASGKYDNNGLSDRLRSVMGDIEKELEREGLGRRKDLVSTIEESANRKMHLQAIMAQQAPPVVTDLIRLIRDEDNDIRRETMFIAGKFRIKDLLPEICECLENHHISRDAYSVLRSFGEEAFPALSRHFARSSGNIMVRRLIARLFAETGGEKAIDFLLPGLWSVNSLLRKEAVEGLIRCGYKADDHSRGRIHHEVLNIVGLLTWNLSARLALEANDDRLLYEAIEKDSQWWTDLLFDMLSLACEKNVLDEIKENLEQNTAESINYAFEILDISIDDRIKPQLRALLDRLPPKIKFKNLSGYHPVDVPDYEVLVTDLINKDYNHIGLWTKVCALRRLYEVQKPGETDFLVALLFGVHRILREEACRYLQENYDDVYSSCSYRLPRLYRDQLDELLKKHIPGNELVYEKLKSLLLIFPGLPERVLISLAEDVKLVSGRESESIEQEEDIIIWPVESRADDLHERIYFNWHTAGQKFNADEIEVKQEAYYMLYVRDIEKFVFYESRYSSLMANYLDRIIVENKPLPLDITSY
ncbi:MAG: hypothetical protein RQ743_09355 [Bacteroidales bacterium]|nr:hypothetical protein [Bacteroidales bacterium]